MDSSKKTEDEFFINKRKLGELFDSKFPLNINLWRGQKPNERGSPILYPILKSFLLSNGNERPADIETKRVNGELWVKCTSGGVSLFDKFGVPNKKWDYYKIALNTQIPKGLVITKDRYNKRHDSTHYSIRPNWDMPVTKFCMLLDELAANLTPEN